MKSIKITFLLSLLLCSTAFAKEVQTISVFTESIEYKGELYVKQSGVVKFFRKLRNGGYLLGAPEFTVN